ncbi:MAG: hypothetical protein Q9220_001679 [cf. Caloplaca sp. 1 TL-2023]
MQSQDHPQRRMVVDLPSLCLRFAFWAINVIWLVWQTNDALRSSPHFPYYLGPNNKNTLIVIAADFLHSHPLYISALGPLHRTPLFRCISLIWGLIVIYVLTVHTWKRGIIPRSIGTDESSSIGSAPGRTESIGEEDTESKNEERMTVDSIDRFEDVEEEASTRVGKQLKEEYEVLNEPEDLGRVEDKRGEEDEKEVGKKGEEDGHAVDKMDEEDKDESHQSQDAGLGVVTPNPEDGSSKGNGGPAGSELQDVEKENWAKEEMMDSFEDMLGKFWEGIDDAGDDGLSRGSQQ